MEDFLVASLTALVGILFGILAVMIGIGGGLMNVPYFIFVLNIDEIATLTSTYVILFTSISGTIKYYRQNRIDIKTGLIFSVIAVPGALLGAYTAQKIITDVSIIKFLFAVLIGLTALKNLLKKNSPSDTEGTPVLEDHEESFYLQKRRIVAENGQVYEYTVKIGIGSLVALAGGFVAGLLGVGGGIIFVPLLTSVVGVPIHIAAATSTFMIVFMTIVVLTTRFLLFEGDITPVLFWGTSLAIGAVIGAYFGAAKAKKIDSVRLLKLFWFVALISSIRMGWGALF